MKAVDALQIARAAIRTSNGAIAVLLKWCDAVDAAREARDGLETLIRKEDDDE